MDEKKMIDILSNLDFGDYEYWLDSDKVDYDDADEKQKLVEMAISTIVIRYLNLKQENNFLKQLYSGTEEFKKVEKYFRGGIHLE